MAIEGEAGAIGRLARRWPTIGIAASAVFAMAGAALSSSGTPAPPHPYAANVAKAVCGPGDAPEVGLQGQVTMAERSAGYKGANCNLTLVSNLPSKSFPEATRMFTLVHDRAGHLCGIATGGGGKMATIVVDMTDPKHLVETASLTSPAMMRSSEALKANETRGLLVSTSYVSANTANTNPEERTLDVYDIGTDCRQPKMLASVRLPFPTERLKTGYHGFRWPNPDYVMGHEGNFAPDGMTFYVADANHGVHHAIDLADPAHPKLLDTFMAPSWNGYTDGPNDSFLAFGAMPHSLSVSADGNRAYFSIAAFDSRLDLIPQTGRWLDGFMVVDTSEIQRRTPGGRMRFLSQVTLHDGGGHHGPLFVKINGHPYVIDNDEFGAGQLTVNGRLAACRAGLPPNGMARIWDMKDELHPKLVSKLILEVNDPKNCAAVEPETIAGSAQWALFLYDTHLCGVDNRENATVLVCGYMQSGIRVYDIRDPTHVKEIAYFNPPAGKPNHVSSCAGIPRLDAKTRMLYEAQRHTTWMALDEFPSLGRVESLASGPERLRKYGGAVVLGMQQFSQIQEIYGHSPRPSSASARQSSSCVARTLRRPSTWPSNSAGGRRGALPGSHSRTWQLGALRRPSDLGDRRSRIH